jgi:hypothetical protein
MGIGCLLPSSQLPPPPLGLPWADRFQLTLFLKNPEQNEFGFGDPERGAHIE